MENTEEVRAFCFRCDASVVIKDPLKIKWRNRRKKNGHVDCWKGRCSVCDGIVYKIIS